MAGVSKRPTVLKPQAAVISSAVSVPTGPPCKGRSVKKLQTFMRHIGNDTTKINILLARALLNDDMLDAFDGYPHASECAFSYPDSDWYSVYLLDEDGNKVWDPEAGHAKLYFKIIVDGSDAHIDEDTLTNDTPDELIDPNTGAEIANCVVSGSSCTGTRPKVKASPAASPAKGVRRVASSKASPEQILAALESTPIPEGMTAEQAFKIRSEVAAQALAGVRQPRQVGRPPSGKAVGRPPATAAPLLVPPDILSGLESLTIAPGGGSKAPGSKGPEKITRDYFEEMKSKDVIVDWMIKNMSRADLIKCIEKGAVSASDVSEAQALAEVEPSMEEPPPAAVVAAAESMPESEFKRMLKKATKESIKESLSGISDPVAKKQAVVDLCTRAGIPGYSVRANKKGVMKIIDPDDEPIDEGDISQLLDTCATNESIRLKAVIDRLRKQYIKSGIVYAAREKNAPVPEPVAEAITLESIIGQIMAIGTLEQKKTAIVELCERNGNPKGYSAKANKKGVLKIYDADDEPIDDSDIDDVLKECAELEFTHVSAFGKKRKARSGKTTQQNKFKAAAKKCKGKSNYRKCMSSMLKKKGYSFGKKRKTTPGSRKRETTGGSKYVSKGRKSPEASATTKKIGTVMIGLDGNSWVVKKASNGVKRWSKA